MKKTLTAVFLCLVVAASFAACSTSDAGSSSMSSMATPAATPSASPEVPSEVSSEVSPDASDDMLASQSLAAYAKAVKAAYGGDYIPDKMFTDSEIQSRLNLSSDLYEDIYAEGSTLTENPDVFVAVKAKPGQTADVAAALTQYRDTLAADTNFAANVDKIKAAQVYTQGDVVFLFLLGANEFPEDMENIGDQFAAQVQKGVDAVKSMFT